MRDEGCSEDLCQRRWFFFANGICAIATDCALWPIAGAWPSRPRVKTDAATAQAVLGHSDLETTLNVYSHAIPDWQKPAAESGAVSVVKCVGQAAGTAPWIAQAYRTLREPVLRLPLVRASVLALTFQHHRMTEQANLETSPRYLWVVVSPCRTLVFEIATSRYHLHPLLCRKSARGPQFLFHAFQPA